LQNIFLIFTHQKIKKLAEKGLVESSIDLEEQIQQSGIDMTVEKIFALEGAGTIDFSNEERKFPEEKELDFENDKIKLEKGCYKVRFNEVVSIPANATAFGLSRSSLLRMGAFVETALWDPGFKGKSESLLVVKNPAGLIIKKNARVMQLVFIELEEDSENTYDGIHQNLGVKENAKKEESKSNEKSDGEN